MFMAAPGIRWARLKILRCPLPRNLYLVPSALVLSTGFSMSGARRYRMLWSRMVIQHRDLGNKLMSFSGLLEDCCLAGEFSAARVSVVAPGAGRKSGGGGAQAGTARASAAMVAAIRRSLARWILVPLALVVTGKASSGMKRSGTL